MTKETPDFWDKYPQMIRHSIQMDEPNQPIPIFTGDFIIQRDKNIIFLTGEIKFDWFPSKKVIFNGVVKKNDIDLGNLFDPIPKTELIVEDIVFGECTISGTKINTKTEISGFMIKDPVWGDRSIEVSSIRFAIPNFKDFHAEPIKHKDGEIVHFNRRRLIFSDDDYNIVIDGLPNHRELKDKLSQKGGYIIQYYGEITKQNKPLNHNEIKFIIPCLSSFLSFINGRRVSTIFHQGICNQEVIWTDYSVYKSDIYKTVFNWSVWDDTSDFNNIWNSYKNLWSNDLDRDFIDSAIHWYLEANANTAYIEGAIIMTQIGLELIYNWFVIEKNGLLIGKDAENITASNKIRLLLSQIKVDPEIPDSLTELKSYVSKLELPDGIEAFVQIRNALVHSQGEKRKRLQIIEDQVLIEAHELGLWYLELSILKILDYKGGYYSRCLMRNWDSSNFQKVPWIENN